MPSRQRAVALRLAHTRVKIRSGAKAWASCDVIPWEAWLARCSAAVRHGPPRELRLLGAAEEWLLWRDAAATACEGLELLAPAQLADALRRSSALMRDWGMRWPGAPTPEASVLLQARQIFSDRCSALRARPVSDWSQALQQQLRAEPVPLVFAGFGAMGEPLALRLRELGATFWPAQTAADSQPPCQFVACADPADELRQAARWCRELLQRDPHARVLVVDPMLARRRALAVQVFEHELHGCGLLDGPAEPLFAIEGGQELAGYAMVAAALGLLELGGGSLEFPALAALLRSPYMGCGTSAQRATLELSLRARNVQRANCASLRALARPHDAADDSALATALEHMSTVMATSAGERESGAGWARRFAALLEAGGWPGAQPLGSEEQQQCERFRELLGEFSMLGGGEPLLTCGQAVELLRALAMRTAYDSATGDTPVTLTSSTDDPLTAYDGIWVAGLGADTWPEPSRADPFVPLAAQRAVSFPAASPQGRLGAAQRAMAAWRRCARQLVYSWPGSDGDVPLLPSSLLAVPRHDESTPPDPTVQPLADVLVTTLRRGAHREPRPLDRARAWPAGRPLIGGTGVLQLQSLCPFRAVAESRLGAVPVPEPTPGLDRRERGRLLHRALELTWGQLGNSRELLRCAGDGASLATLVRTASERALRERLVHRAQPLATALAENETLRVATLVQQLLHQELQRAAAGEFRIAALEESRDCELGGRALRVRMDRLDQLGDGRMVVIDYKSGAAQGFRPLDERPRQAQLLVYALLAGSNVAGVAAVHLLADQIRWRGAVADDSLLPALGRMRAPTAPWPELLAHWRRVIERLVQDFTAGEAAVDPLPGVCRTCSLAALCRVDSGRMQQPDPDSEDAGVGDAA